MVIKIDKKELIQKWIKLIEFDGDDIYLYNHTSNDIICVELSESLMPGSETEGIKIDV